MKSVYSKHITIQHTFYYNGKRRRNIHYLLPTKAENPILLFNRTDVQKVKKYYLL